MTAKLDGSASFPLPGPGMPDGRWLVVVAGVPGAGKSTLLRSLPPAERAALTVVDSDPVREWLRRRLPAGTDYRRYRPLVHLVHRLRIVGAVCSAAPTVVVHLPATAAFTRAWLAVVGVVGGRGRLLLWLDVDPAEARRGQRDRGRVLASGCFDRHVRRADAFGAGLRSGRPTPGWRVRVIDRAAATHPADSG